MVEISPNCINFVRTASNLMQSLCSLHDEAIFSSSEEMKCTNKVHLYISTSMDFKAHNMTKTRAGNRCNSFCGCCSYLVLSTVKCTSVGDCAYG